jgi:hypothetical protein
VAGACLAVYFISIHRLLALSPTISAIMIRIGPAEVTYIDRSTGCIGVLARLATLPLGLFNLPEALLKTRFIWWNTHTVSDEEKQHCQDSTNNHAV